MFLIKFCQGLLGPILRRSKLMNCYLDKSIQNQQLKKKEIIIIALKKKKKDLQQFPADWWKSEIWNWLQKNTLNEQFVISRDVRSSAQASGVHSQTRKKQSFSEDEDNLAETAILRLPTGLSHALTSQPQSSWNSHVFRTWMSRRIWVRRVCTWVKRKKKQKREPHQTPELRWRTAAAPGPDGWRRTWGCSWWVLCLHGAAVSAQPESGPLCQSHSSVVTAPRSTSPDLRWSVEHRKGLVWTRVTRSFTLRNTSAYSVAQKLHQQKHVIGLYYRVEWNKMVMWFRASSRAGAIAPHTDVHKTILNSLNNVNAFKKRNK